MTVVTIPNDWAPRDHQLGYWNAKHHEGSLRNLMVWHRRAGKDSVCINSTAVCAVTEPGLYYYMAPSQKHARKIIWDNIGADGRRIISQAFPDAIRKSTNDQEMRIVVESQGGRESIFQVVGSDNYDGIVGSNPRGIVFSEWALAAKPEAWEYFAPILLENGGWADFISTPRGMNHYYKLWRTALANDDWYAQRQTVEDTGILTPEQIQAERESGYPELRIRQEYYCEFLSANEAQVFDGELLINVMECRDEPDFDQSAPCIIGVDVARFGDDRTVIATRIGRDFSSVPPIVLQNKDLVQTARIIEAHAHKFKPDAIVIDATGLGAGVVDILRREMRIRAKGIHFSEKARDTSTYANIRTEMYFLFKEWMEDPGSVLWNNEGLRNELASIEYEYDTHGRIRLETKEAAKKRIGTSPDLADAYALTFTVRPPRKDAWHVRRNTDTPPQAVISW